MQESPSNSLFGTFENRVNVADWQIMQSVPYKYNETTIVTEQRDPYVETIDAPFWPRFGENGTVIFAKGYIVQRDVRTSSISYIQPANVEVEIGMVAGETAYVQFQTSSNGTVIGVPAIIVGEPVGGRFYPPIGLYEGTDGTFYYKLCTIVVDDDGNEIFERYHSGDNIEHIIERGSMLNLYTDYGSPEDGEFYEVLKEYQPSEDTVYFRTLEQLGEPGVPIISSTSSGDSIAFRRVKERADYDAQIKVIEDSDAILVQGNGKEGSLMGTYCSGAYEAGEAPEPVPLLTWEDGLITSDSSSVQLMPIGARGDILYHDGACWVVLNKPVTSTTHVLAISGDIPYWLETQDCDEESPPPTSEEPPPTSP
jgi:hypothetical protein